MRWMLLVLMLGGCGIVADCPTTTPECVQLDFESRAWQAVALAGGGIGAVTAAGAPIADEWASDEDRGDWQLGLGITGAIGGALGVLGTLMGQSVSEAALAAGCGGVD